MGKTSGSSTTTQYAYDTKGMRIIKDGPYGKSIYVDVGYVESGASTGSATDASRASAPAIESNHVFVGNTRVASVVKHKDETQAATYYYATDHLGSSSVLTTQTGSYYERLEYLPYGETWVHNKASDTGYTTPYKFTGKELDPETGLYYFGHRYRDPRIGQWLSADPALSRYLPVGSSNNSKLPAGGVFVSVNLNLYHYGGNNPVIYVDPDGLFNIKTGEIEKGDTLKSITQQLNSFFGTNLSIFDVAKANNIKNPDKIRAGDYIVLPGKNIELHFDNKNLSGWDTKYNTYLPGIKWAGISGQPGKYEPLPNGLYQIDPASTLTFSKNTRGLFDIAKWLLKSKDWGFAYTPLKPINVPIIGTRGRFFIHGGWFPGSAGCIDLTDENNSFHEWFLNRNERLNVRVDID